MKYILFLLFITSSISTMAQTEDAYQSWEKYSTPGPVQKFLAKYKGNWTAKIKVWEAPDTEPTLNNGQAQINMLLGGRYQQTEFSGIVNGLKTMGQSLLAWDNAKEEFQSTWIDNMGTGIIYMTGRWSEEFKSIHLDGDMVDPTTNNLIHVSQDWYFIDDNTQVMKGYFILEEGIFQNIEINYTRSTK